MKKLFAAFASALLICALVAGPAAAAAFDDLKGAANKTANKIDQKVDKKQVKDDINKGAKDIKGKTVDKK